MMLHFRCVICY